MGGGSAYSLGDLGQDVTVVDPKASLKRLEEQKRRVTLMVDGLNAAQAAIKRADAAYHGWADNLPKEVFALTPHHYAVTGRLDGGTAVARIKEALLKDEGLQRRFAEWKQSELARLEKRRNEDVEFRQKIATMSTYDWMREWADDRGDRDKYLQKIAGDIAEDERQIAEVKATQPSVSTREMEQVLWDSDRWHTAGPGRFQADGYTVVLSVTQTESLGTAAAPNTKTGYREGSTHSDATTKGDSTARNSQWNMSRGGELGAGGPAPAPTAKGTFSEQQGGGKTYTTNQSDTHTQTTSRDKSYEAQLGGTQGERQMVTVRATITDSNGKQTTVDIGRVEVIKK